MFEELPFYVYIAIFIVLLLLIFLIFKNKTKIKFGKLSIETNSEDVFKNITNEHMNIMLQLTRCINTYTGQIERVILGAFREVLGLDISASDKNSIKLLCSNIAKENRFNVIMDVITNHMGESEDDVKTYSKAKANYYYEFISNDIHKYNNYICQSIDFVKVINLIDTEKLEDIYIELYLKIYKIKTEGHNGKQLM